MPDLSIAVAFDFRMVSENLTKGFRVNRNPFSRRPITVYTRRGARHKAETISTMVALESRRLKLKWLPNTKVYLDIWVTMADHKADAINVLTVVANAVKRGIRIDDRWFAVRRLDWDIAPGTQPVLIIRVIQ